MDATFRLLRHREAFAAGFDSASPPVFFAQCVAPAEVLLQRARGREGEPAVVSDAGPAVVERQLRELGPLHEVPGDLRSELRTDRPAGEVVVELEAALDGLLGLS